MARAVGKVPAHRRGNIESARPRGRAMKITLDISKLRGRGQAHSRRGRAAEDARLARDRLARHQHPDRLRRGGGRRRRGGAGADAADRGRARHRAVRARLRRRAQPGGAMERARPDLPGDRRADVRRRRDGLRRRLAGVLAHRHRGVRARGHRGALEPVDRAGGAGGLRLSRRAHRLQPRHVFAGDLRADADHRAVRRAGVRGLSGLQTPAGRLRAHRADGVAHLDRAGQFRLLDRLAVGRSLDAAARSQRQ